EVRALGNHTRIIGRVAEKLRSGAARTAGCTGRTAARRATRRCTRACDGSVVVTYNGANFICFGIAHFILLPSRRASGGKDADFLLGGAAHATNAIHATGSTFRMPQSTRQPSDRHPAVRVRWHSLHSHVPTGPRGETRNRPRDSTPSRRLRRFPPLVHHDVF